MPTESADYRRGRSVVYRLTVHLVLVTKYRRGPITDRVRELLIATTEDVCGRHGVQLLEADGECDHLHLLVDMPPKLSVSALVGSIKTNTSRVVREQGWPEVQTRLWGDHFWSPSYFAATTGGVQIDTIRKYIQDQRVPSRGPGRPRRSSAAE